MTKTNFDKAMEFKNSIESKIHEHIELESVDPNVHPDDLKFRIYHPFHFNDGDCFSIVLKRIGKKWCISDEGNLYFHMGIFFDDRLLDQEPCKSYIDKCRTQFNIEDRDTELVLFIEDNDYDTAIYDYLQFCLRFMHVYILAEPELYGLQKLEK